MYSTFYGDGHIIKMLFFIRPSLARQAFNAIYQRHNCIRCVKGVRILENIQTYKTDICFPLLPFLFFIIVLIALQNPVVHFKVACIISRSLHPLVRLHISQVFPSTLSRIEETDLEC